MKIASFFSGAGGMDLGFILSGHEIVFSIDFNHTVYRTYNNNITKYMPHKSIYEDITYYIPTQKDVENKIPDVDILVGGFPCQGFSIANLKRSMEDKRNFLYLELLKVIRVKQPKFVILENVKGLSNMEKGRVLITILNDIEELGYNVTYNIFNMADYGVPQKRERVIIFGVRNDIFNTEEFKKFVIQTEVYRDFKKRDLRNTYYRFLEQNYRKFYIKPTHDKDSNIPDVVKPHEFIEDLFTSFKQGKLKERLDKFQRSDTIYKWNTLKDAIGDLPLTPNGENNHVAPKNKLDIKDRVGQRPTYWDKPSPTIITATSLPHPSLKRRMTIRELARIQTFPDSFFFEGGVTAGLTQVGNAVPPLFTFHLGMVLREYEKSVVV